MSLLHSAAALRYLQAENIFSENTLEVHDNEASQAHELSGTGCDKGNNNRADIKDVDNDANLIVDDLANANLSLTDSHFKPRQLPANGVRCPRCAEQGIEQIVLAGKHCPRCGLPC